MHERIKKLVCDCGLSESKDGRSDDIKKNECMKELKS